MSQKFQSAAAAAAEPLYHEPFLRRHSAPKTKVVRDTSSRGIRAERVRDHGSKGDSLVRKEPEHVSAVEFSIRTKSKHHSPGSGSAHGKYMPGPRNGDASPNGGPQCETWGRILKTQSSKENISGFSKFDPLRTIHFLGKELQSQLKNIPHDSTVYDVICEMQSALKRIPQDIQLIADTAAKKQEGRPRKSDKMTKSKSESCQTPNMWYLEPVRLQQHLEESSEKIEKACQQMEALCSKLKAEKEHLAVQLEIEKESSKLVKHQADELKLKLQGANVLVESLSAQNSLLHAEVEKQKVQLSTQDTPSAGKLKLFIQSLKENNALVTAENEHLKQQIQLAHNETEKYEAILNARDMQVKEIRFEMTQLQEVVNEQMVHFQSLSTSEEPTTNATTPNHSPHAPEPTSCNQMKIRIEDPNFQTSSTSEPVQELFSNRHNQYDDAHSAGGSTRFSADDQLSEMHGLHIDADNLKLRHVYKVPVSNVIESPSLREKFLEAKCLGLSLANRDNQAPPAEQ